MSANMQVVLEGLPERVQETADMLDRAFPGLMTWRRFAMPARDCVIRLEGVGAVRNTLFPRRPHLTDQAPVLSKAWKVSLAASRAVPQRGLMDPLIFDCALSCEYLGETDQDSPTLAACSKHRELAVDEAPVPTAAR